MAQDLREALEIMAVTDTGLVRQNNEDAVSVLPDQGLVLLADGMGGYNAGEVASSMAVTLLARSLGALDFAELSEEAALDAIGEAIEEVNRIIYQASLEQLKYAGMGTTVVAGCFVDDRLYITHLGDSRAYRLREGSLTRLTHDHSPIQAMIDAGLLSEDIARRTYGKHLVNRALGVAPQVEPESSIHAVLPGDLYLFCSDGLVDMVDDHEITQTLSQPDLRLFEAAEHLIHQANGNGGLDNISLILARVDATFPAKPR